MSITADFTDAINSGDILLTRIMIMNSLIQDLTLQDFEERLSYAENNLSDLYDEHDGEVFSDDITTWKSETLDEQIAKSYTNFSRERVSFVKRIARHVRPQEAENADRKKFVETHSKGDIGPVQVGAAVSVAGAAAIVCGGVMACPPVTVAGVAAVTVGGVIIIKNIM